jgi:hypothetical protein
MAQRMVTRNQYDMDHADRLARLAARGRPDEPTGA